MKRSRRLRKGQATIEFALVVPVLVIIVLGLQSVGVRIITAVDVTQAARAGADAAATAVDEIDRALSCTAPVSENCLQSAMSTIKEMVDAGLPCPDDSSSSPVCTAAGSALAGQAILVGLSTCAHLARDCNNASLPPLATMIGSAESQGCAAGSSDAACRHDTEAYAEAAMEAGLGCVPPPRNPSTSQPARDCPQPPNYTARPSPPPWPFASCTPSTTCKGPDTGSYAQSVSLARAVSVESIGLTAQKALACLAVRRSLGMDLSTSTCEYAGDDPTITMAAASSAQPSDTIPVQCVDAGTVPVRLYGDICAGGHAMVIEKVSVVLHSYDVTATATAVPASQFLLP